MRLFEGTPFDRIPTCDRCGRAEDACECPPEAPKSKIVPPEKQTARISTERRKKGKLVTVIRGLAAEANDLPALLTHLKNACGAGGTIDDDALEIQGDQVEKVKTLLSGLGYKVR